MRIGIDASRAFLKYRTGIEEYSYQVIKHLRTALPSNADIVLYVRKQWQKKDGKPILSIPEIDFDLPKNWRMKGIWAPRFWTQIGLSLEMLFHRPDVLFIPAHTVPLIHPKRTFVTVHGLEYEVCPEGYAWWERFYMRSCIRFSARFAEKVIAVSNNTKRDLMRLYQTPEEKIEVIYEGFEASTHTSAKLPRTIRPPYFLFVGRLEARKNIVRIIAAFEVFKQKMNSSHQLVLVGKQGYRFKDIEKKLAASKYASDIVVTGYVSSEEKVSLLQQADALLFPTLYEGFGLPVIEAQSFGVPVITSMTSSLPEIAGEGALLVDPTKTKKIAKAMEKLVTEPEIRADIIGKATRNATRFSWALCARKLTSLLLSP